MEEIPLPIEISKQVWLVPCRISENKEHFTPLLSPDRKQDTISSSKFKWKTEEDELLKTLAKKSKRWSAIAKEINLAFYHGLAKRDGKQCRERWNNHLNPNLNKSPWTTFEDFTIIESYKDFGSKWAKIAKLLKTRTENQVKNRWKSLKGKTSLDSTCSSLYAINALDGIEPFGNIEFNVGSPMGSFKTECYRSPMSSISAMLDLMTNPAQMERIAKANRDLDLLLFK